ncbi:dihydroorotate dehydrogenase-like protein [Synechococcus sp. CS-1328]|uniref:dihydroorotate dehydrogenase-like protein n=1 Tax=Synechococcus sp. CS-1328 TaxID=2847976 RepID=UPI00223A9749|nr:dihydroorotate dehydrogenase-like protein [Synechococcus sp. CS-1328]MCT0225059.1 dihydroorotate dehydrogenase-like protein [Synechococcus sp. CS-1328]
MSPDLSTTYLGLELRSPLVVGAARPLSEDPDVLLALERAGAGAIVLHSLFQEEIEQQQLDLHRHLLQGSDSYGEALSYVPETAISHGGDALYLRHLDWARQHLAIPVIASLNGTHPGRWVETARRMEAAGAAAIELNIYALPTDPLLSSAAIEAEVEEIVREVRAEVSLPLAVKLSPFFTNLAAMVRRLREAGADGLVLFNRFYQPDIDIETLEVRPNLLLSTPHDLRLPMRWIALLHGHEPLDLAGSGGVHRGTDAVRLLMAGACVTQVVGALLRHGPQRLSGLEEELRQWLAEHEHGSVRELIGCMSQSRCPNPSEFERAHYMLAVQTFRPAAAAAAPGPW